MKTGTQAQYWSVTMFLHKSWAAFICTCILSACLSSDGSGQIYFFFVNLNFNSVFLHHISNCHILPNSESSPAWWQFCLVVSVFTGVHGFLFLLSFFSNEASMNLNVGSSFRHLTPQCHSPCPTPLCRCRCCSGLFMKTRNTRSRPCS